jgi:hypothetical protein
MSADVSIPNDSGPCEEGLSELEMQQAIDGKVAGVAAFLKAGSANALFSGGFTALGKRNLIRLNMKQGPTI